MLAKTLLADTFSVLLALGSFAFYLAGFFYPEVHRRTDLVWSGLGLLYAALLWFCAGQMTVAVLLAQLIVVALLLGLGWQTLSVRREKTPVYQQTPIAITPDVVSGWTKNRLNQLRIAPKDSVPVRLEKRASGQQLDPRRRPAYDYEFVEDGLVEAPATNLIAEATEALSEVLSLESLSLEAEQVDEVASKMASEIIVEVPPSVEAEIISVEEPEAPEPATPDQAAEAQAIPDQATDSNEDANVSGVVASSIATRESTEDLTAVAKDETLSGPIASDAILESESEQTKIDRTGDRTGTDRTGDRTGTDNSAASEDWDDELFDDTPVESTPSADAPLASQPLRPPATKSKTPPIAATGEKPSLLEIPVILVGWAKDVVTSLTRPKPSKPVIEIPRRDHPSAISNPARNATRPSTETVTAPSVAPTPSNAEFTATQAAEPEWGQGKAEVSCPEVAPANAPQEDNWEESNWDD